MNHLAKQILSRFLIQSSSHQDSLSEFYLNIPQFLLKLFDIYFPLNLLIELDQELLSSFLIQCIQKHRLVLQKGVLFLAIITQEYHAHVRRFLSRHETRPPGPLPPPTSEASNSLVPTPGSEQPSTCVVRCLPQSKPTPHTQIEEQVAYSSIRVTK